MALPPVGQSTVLVDLVVFDRDNRGTVVLYEVLVRAGYRARLLFFLRDTPAARTALFADFDREPPVWCGLSFATHSLPTVRALAGELRRRFPRLPVLAGGAHPSMAPETCLDFCDAVCTGEGEETVLAVSARLAAAEEWRTAPNLVYRQGTAVRHTERAALCDDLDRLPPLRLFTADHYLVTATGLRPVSAETYYSLYPHERYRYQRAFARGCPQACTYCGHACFRKLDDGWHRVRRPSPERVVEELRQAVRDNPRLLRISLLDDDFFAHGRDWLRQFADGYRAQVGRELNVAAFPESVNPEVCMLWRGIPLRYVSLGLQSGSVRSNRLYGRAFSSDRFIAACRLLHEHGIGLVLHIILDNPWEDEDDVATTLAVLDRVPRPYAVFPYSLKAYPGTPLLRHLAVVSPPLPHRLLDYANYHRVAITDRNRALLLSALLPRGWAARLWRGRGRVAGRMLLRVVFAAGWLLRPMLALRVAGGRCPVATLRLALSHAGEAGRWLRSTAGRD